MLHPDVDGIGADHILALEELDFFGKRIVALNAVERLLGDSDQRLMLMRARSLYAANAREALDKLIASGFDWTPEMSEAARKGGPSAPAR